MRVSDESLQHYLGQASTEECNCWSCNCIRDLCDARARCKKLEEALGLVEWVAEQDVHPPPDKVWCPCCGSYQDEGHDKSCEVAHALREKGGEE